MRLKRPKTLLNRVQDKLGKKLCPDHKVPAEFKMESESAKIQIKACCGYFLQKITSLVGDMEKEYLKEQYKKLGNRR